MSSQRLHLQLHPRPPNPHPCLYLGPSHQVLADRLRAEVMGIPYTKLCLEGAREAAKKTRKRFRRKGMFSSERPRGDRGGSCRRLKEEERIDLLCVTPQGTNQDQKGRSRGGQRQVYLLE